MWLGTDELHVVLLNAPSTGGLSNSTTETCKHINVGRYESVMFVLTIGTNSVTTSNFYLMEASTATAAGQYTAAYNYRIASTAAAATTATDTLSARAAGVSTALVMSSTAETMYVIEVKNTGLTEGYSFVYPSVSSAAATRNIAAVAICRPRYIQNSMLVPNS